ncbi:MAG: hypothetical protein AAF206_19505, partial [Bacteroidota bacterium]
MLKRRSEPTSFVDAAQAMANHGVDARLLIHETHDAICHERCHARNVMVAAFDIVRGFPFLREEVAVLALHEAGERGSTLLCTAMVG